MKEKLVVAVAEGKLAALMPSTDRLEEIVLVLPPESVAVMAKGNTPAVVAVPPTAPELTPSVTPGGRFVDVYV